MALLRSISSFAAILALLPACSTAFVPANYKLPGAAFLHQSSNSGVSPIKYVNGEDHTANVPTAPAAATTAAFASSALQDKIKEQQQQQKQRSYVKPGLNHNVCPQTGITLSRYMMEMEQLNPELEQVESMFTSIQVACKAISKLVRNSQLHGTTGLAHGGGSINVQGEEQKQMDILANDALKSALRWAGTFKTIASEEEDIPVDGSSQLAQSAEAFVEKGAKYIAVFDPLDGSSNIDAGIPVGTIFGIFEHSEECAMDEAEDACTEDVLQSGHNLVAAGYCFYSSATTLVFTLGDGTHGFTLDESLGEFVLTHPNIKIPERGSIYSANEGNRWDWDKSMQDYITTIQKGKGETGQRYSARYVGSMVADVHRTLQFGGIFAYPADKKNVNGKLRLLYEAAPMAFIVEQAGGLATTGTRDIMDVLPTDVHDRVPCILGSKDDVKELQSYYQQQQPKSNGLDWEGNEDDAFTYFT